LACTYSGLADPNRESNIGEVTYAEFWSKAFDP
jgi:hypothetical protein